MNQWIKPGIDQQRNAHCHWICFAPWHSLLGRCPREFHDIPSVDQTKEAAPAFASVFQTHNIAKFIQEVNDDKWGTYVSWVVVMMSMVIA